MDHWASVQFRNYKRKEQHGPWGPKTQTKIPPNRKKNTEVTKNGELLYPAFSGSGSAPPALPPRWAGPGTTASSNFFRFFVFHYCVLITFKNSTRTNLKVEQILNWEKNSNKH
jgi:hypothetical protein